MNRASPTDPTPLSTCVGGGGWHTAVCLCGPHPGYGRNPQRGRLLHPRVQVRTAYLADPQTGGGQGTEDAVLCGGVVVHVVEIAKCSIDARGMSMCRHGRLL